jgi:pyrimidine deaminase RibD-like protein
MNPDDDRMTVRLIQPDWLRDWLRRPSPAADDRARLAEVIALAGANVDHDLGGPFAAAVYALDDGRRLSAAVNTTITSHCSAAHAELQALSLAQQAMGTHTLESRPCVLVSSSAPCTMCLGARSPGAAYRAWSSPLLGRMWRSSASTKGPQLRAGATNSPAAASPCVARCCSAQAARYSLATGIWAG